MGRAIRVITSTIDGGGVMNIYGGAAPGGLIQAGSGTVTLSGTPNFAGNITVNSGAGPLNISPAGGASAAYSGGWFGGGTVNVNCSGTFSLGGGASNFTGTINMLQPGTLQFVPAAGTTSTFSGTINGGGSVVQNGPGTTVLSARTTTAAAPPSATARCRPISARASRRRASSPLDGGVLQSNGSSTVNFTRSLGTSGATFQWTANGGGFSAGGGPMVVNVGGNATPDTLSLGFRAGRRAAPRSWEP